MRTTKDLTDELIRQTCELMATVKKINETDYITEANNFEYLTDRLEMLSEKYTCSVRDFAIKTYVSNWDSVMDKAAVMQEIEVQKDGSTVVIELPFLLPRKKGRQHNFICDPLRYRLEEISKSVNLKIRKKAVICIVHIYNNSGNTVRCYDYDNLESKKILDTVALFTLTDDSPEYCDIYQTSRCGNADKTRIMIMPQEEFRKKILSLIL